MDDGSDDFYRGLTSADAFTALMSAPMSQRRDRHRWRVPALKLYILPINLPIRDLIVSSCSPVSGEATVANLSAEGKLSVNTFIIPSIPTAVSTST